MAIRVHQRRCVPLRSAANVIYLKRGKLSRHEGLAPEKLSDLRQDIRDEVNHIDDLPHPTSKVCISKFVNLHAK